MKHVKRFNTQFNESFDAFYGQKADLTPSEDRITHFEYTGEEIQTVSTNRLNGRILENGSVDWTTSNNGRFTTRKIGLL